jgi:soluble P-type ATPase
MSSACNFKFKMLGHCGMEAVIVLQMNIPGLCDLELEHLVLDYNGTLALDGVLLGGIKEQLPILSQILMIHVLTADTFGNAKQQLEGLPVTLAVIEKSQEMLQKRAYIDALGAGTVVAFGNGSNDEEMLRTAALGICILGAEGCSSKALAAADVLVRDMWEGLQLLIKPKRLTATLRE